MTARSLRRTPTGGDHTKKKSDRKILQNISSSGGRGCREVKTGVGYTPLNPDNYRWTWPYGRVRLYLFVFRRVTGKQFSPREPYWSPKNGVFGMKSLQTFFGFYGSRVLQFRPPNDKNKYFPAFSGVIIGYFDWKFKKHQIPLKQHKITKIVKIRIPVYRSGLVAPVHFLN